jgi:hypothetical protein
VSLTEEIKRILFGYTISQEYVCLDDKIQSPFNVLLNADPHPVDVTTRHLLLGYKPLIIGLVTSDELQLHNTNKIKLSFSYQQRTVAQLTLSRVPNAGENETNVVLFMGTHGSHKFLSQWHQINNRLKERFKLFSKGNVFLPMNLYEQVRIAYSLPRQIAIVTLGKDGLFNMFPTDLHGHAGERFYIGSLRKDGKACEQVMTYKNICLSTVPLSWKDNAYLLGKNHMKEPGALNEPYVDKERSSSFDLPLPEGLLSYVELIWFHFVDIGIHRIFFYRIVNSKRFRENKLTLYHIHRFYLQWRLNHKLPTNFELRER